MLPLCIVAVFHSELGPCFTNCQLKIFPDESSPVNSVCGDGIIDEGETCGDGNTNSGDGCRRDCLKIEKCSAECIDSNQHDTASCQEALNTAPPFNTGAGLHGIWKREAQKPLSYRPTKKKSLRSARLISLGVFTGSLAGSVGLYMINEFSQVNDTTEIALLSSSLTLMASSFLVGPSAGYLYLGDRLHFLRLSGLRILALGASVGMGAAASEFADPNGRGVGAVAAFFGAAPAATLLLLYIGGDLLYLGSASRRHNQNLSAPEKSPTTQKNKRITPSSWKF